MKTITVSGLSYMPEAKVLIAMKPSSTLFKDPDDIIKIGNWEIVPGDYVATVYEAGETIATHFSESGELTITKHDTTNNIIEAEFHFIATSQSSEEVYEVSEGKVSYNGYYYR